MTQKDRFVTLHWHYFASDHNYCKKIIQEAMLIIWNDYWWPGRYPNRWSKQKLFGLQSCVISLKLYHQVFESKGFFFVIRRLTRWRSLSPGQKNLLSVVQTARTVIIRIDPSLPFHAIWHSRSLPRKSRKAMTNCNAEFRYSAYFNSISKLCSTDCWTG